MYRTAKSLEITEVEVYGCFKYASISFCAKTLIIQIKIIHIALRNNKILNFR